MLDRMGKNLDEEAAEILAELEKAKTEMEEEKKAKQEEIQLALEKVRREICNLRNL